MAALHISLTAEKVGSIFGFPITNSLLTSWVSLGLLIWFSLLATKKTSLIPSNIQLIAEILIEGIHDLFKSIVGEKNISRFFPLLATIFLFVIVGNWIGLLPGVGTLGLKREKSTETHTLSATNSTTKAQLKFIPLFRGSTADLNTTLALALIAVVSIQYFGIRDLKLAYFKKFINLSNPIMFFVGILELISEVSKIISFAFRLFGNMFAGEVLLTVIGSLVPIIAPLPFLGLEIFVGFIQALVFSMLTAVFLSMAVSVQEQH